MKKWHEKYSGSVHIIIGMPEKIICGVYECKEDAQERCDHSNYHNDMKGVHYRIESRMVERKKEVVK